MGGSGGGTRPVIVPDEDSEYISDNVPPTWAGSTDAVLFGGGCIR